jgi:hypothetical protein
MSALTRPTKITFAEMRTADVRGSRSIARTIEALMLVADGGGPTMFARIGVMRALNRHVERVFDPSRKEKHWGQRKLRARSMKQEAVEVAA